MTGSQTRPQPTETEAVIVTVQQLLMEFFSMTNLVQTAPRRSDQRAERHQPRLCSSFVTVFQPTNSRPKG